MPPPEPRASTCLLHHRHRLPRLLVSGTLVNRLDRLRDRRHAQWRSSSPSPPARRSTRRSRCATLHMYWQIGSSIADAGADCPRSGSSDPDPIWIHRSCWLITLDPRIRWLRILCSLSILRFPPYGSTLYNLYWTRTLASVPDWSKMRHSVHQHQHLVVYCFI